MRTKNKIIPISKLKDPLKLDIGCGSVENHRGEDFTTVDLYVPADIKASADAIPLPDNSVDEIWCSHMLEHIAIAKVHGTLKEWLRLLKVGGRAIVQVPNFDYVAKFWFIGQDRAWAEAMIFGQQINEGEFHKSAWTSSVLQADLEQAGFKVERVEMRWSHNQETLQAVCIKPDPAAIKLEQ
jgi:SAM-dependent methyltransferase